MKKNWKKILTTSALLIFLLVAFFHFSRYKNSQAVQTTVEYIVANVEGKAKNFDKNLFGANGVEFGHAGRVWVNNLDNTSIVYNKEGEVVKTKDENGNWVELRVKVEGTLSGLLFSPGHRFDKDAFIFTTKEGKVFGWHKGDDGIERLFAIEKFSSNESVFTGITSIENEREAKIFLADFKNNSVVVLDEKYNRLDMEGFFKDENLPEGMSVYALKQYFGNIYVMYAKKNSSGGVEECLGCGIINVFTKDGKFLRRFESTNNLAEPSSIAFLEGKYPEHTSVALVANSGNGKISLFDIHSGEFLGNIQNTGRDLIIPGINSLSFGSGNGAGSPNSLFFTSSFNGVGLYGKIIFQWPNQELTENTPTIEKFSEKEEMDINYVFQNNQAEYVKTRNELNMGCVTNESQRDSIGCLDERLFEKYNSLGKLVTKIKNDLSILEKEFVVNPLGNKFTEKNGESQKLISNFDLEAWKRLSQTECEIQLTTKYFGQTLNEVVKLCQYRKINILLQGLYEYRAFSIRYYVSEGSEISKAVTAEFQQLRDEEEFKANNSY